MVRRGLRAVILHACVCVFVFAALSKWSYYAVNEMLISKCCLEKIVHLVQGDQTKLLQEKNTTKQKGEYH